MKFHSELTIYEQVDDCKHAANDTVSLCEDIKKFVTKIKNTANEIERNLQMCEADFQDPYDPVTRSLRLLQEIIDATD